MCIGSLFKFVACLLYVSLEKKTNLVVSGVSDGALADGIRHDLDVERRGLAVEAELEPRPVWCPASRVIVFGGLVPEDPVVSRHMSQEILAGEDAVGAVGPEDRLGRVAVAAVRVGASFKLERAVAGVCVRASKPLGGLSRSDGGLGLVWEETGNNAGGLVLGQLSSLLQPRLNAMLAWCLSLAW